MAETPASSAAESSPAAPRAGGLYRLLWRWHFYAGLLVWPFVLLLSLTGGLYLFHDTVDTWWHRDLLTVPEVSATPGSEMSPEHLLAAAQQAVPGRLLHWNPPEAPGRSARIDLLTPQGQRVWVYLDPADGRVLGQLPERGTLGWTLRHLHSLKIIGPWARALIEIAAGWTGLLVLSGLYLWWPRGRRQGVWSLRRWHPGQRVFWRDLHAVGGAAVGGVLLFLALTGMPWSGVWGAWVNQWANGANWGYPAGLRVQLPMSGQRLAEHAETNWSLTQARLPLSSPPGEHAAHLAGQAATQTADDKHKNDNGDGDNTQPPQLGLDAIWRRVQALHLAPGLSLSAPAGPRGVWTASVYPPDLDRQRVVHLDAYSGDVLLDMRWSDYGVAGRWMEWGINVHLGQEWGWANRWGLLLVCAVVALLCLAAPLMWWWRRPAGQLGVPRLAGASPLYWRMLVWLLPACLLFPLAGGALLAVLLLDAGLLSWAEHRERHRERQRVAPADPRGPH
ncbi:MAG: PepSY domain-containing protein [Curvibacter sp.]|nr:MAG: PepSY domain-containing protein [Curvibacter sp.]